MMHGGMSVLPGGSSSSGKRSAEEKAKREENMQCFVYGLRLSSSTWLKGYIPTDTTGDGLYQLLDMATLCLAVYMILCCTKWYAPSYQEQFDTLEIKPVVMAC